LAKRSGRSGGDGDAKIWPSPMRRSGRGALGRLRDQRLHAARCQPSRLQEDEQRPHRSGLPSGPGGLFHGASEILLHLHKSPVLLRLSHQQPALQPPALAKCREINSRRSIPSRRAITGAQLHSDLFVAIRNSQWCTCSEIWQSRIRFDGISLAFPRSLRRRRRLR